MDNSHVRENDPPLEGESSETATAGKCIDCFTLHREVPVVRTAETTIELTPRQWRILKRLLMGAGTVVSHAELCRFAGVPPTASCINLQNELSRLRRRLGVDGKRLQNVRGEGYRFIGRVQLIEWY